MKRSTKRISAWLLVASRLAGLAACGGGSSGPDPAAPDPTDSGPTGADPGEPARSIGEISGTEQGSCPPTLSGMPRLHDPTTTVNVSVGNDDPTPTPTQSAVAFYDAVTSEKTFRVVPRTGHGVHRTPEGTRLLVEAIRRAAARLGA